MKTFIIENMRFPPSILFINQKTQLFHTNNVKPLVTIWKANTFEKVLLNMWKCNQFKWNIFL